VQIIAAAVKSAPGDVREASNASEEGAGSRCGGRCGDLVGPGWRRVQAIHAQATS